LEPSPNHSENLSEKLGKHEMKELQKTATLDTALMYKHRTFNTGNNMTCTVNCSYRTAATSKILLLLKYTMVSTPHISDNNSR
jgi:hypothetical protein